MQENIVCRRLGRFGQALFQTATASFRSAAVRITRTIVFGAQLRSRLRQIAGLRFTILELRFPLPSRCGRKTRSERDAGTSHIRNSERLRERGRSARSVAKSKELASSRFTFLTLLPFNYSLRPQVVEADTAASTQGAGRFHRIPSSSGEADPPTSVKELRARRGNSRVCFASSRIKNSNLALRRGTRIRCWAWTRCRSRSRSRCRRRGWCWCGRRRGGGGRGLPRTVKDLRRGVMDASVS